MSRIIAQAGDAANCIVRFHLMFVKRKFAVSAEVGYTVRHSFGA
jgi:hypothetical protein